MGPPAGELVSGSLASARMHHLAHEVLDNGELRRRYPVFDIDPEWIGVLDAQAGWLAPERSVETHLRLAERHGAALRFVEPVERWEREAEGVRVTTTQGSFRASKLVITAGAWVLPLFPRLSERPWGRGHLALLCAPRNRAPTVCQLSV